MPDFIPINGPVVADTVYADGKLIAKDVSLTLPAVTFMTADVNAMGTMTIPIPQMIEHMELTITKIGVDMGLSSAIKGNVPIEVRWVQNVLDANGNNNVVGCKAFLRCMSAGIPEMELTTGEPGENELGYGVTRYQMFQDGKEAWTIDRLAGICKIFGVDYMGNISSML